MNITATSRDRSNYDRSRSRNTGVSPRTPEFASPVKPTMCSCLWFVVILNQNTLFSLFLSKPQEVVVLLPKPKEVVVLYPKPKEDLFVCVQNAMFHSVLQHVRTCYL